MRSLPLCVLLWFLAAGCAPAVVAPPPSPPMPRATLEVVNRLPEPARIAVDGREIGVVPPGQRQRFRELRPGPRAMWVIAGDLDVRRTLVLRGGAVTQLPILPEDPTKALPEPPLVGHLTLVNPSELDLEIRVNGGAPRTLLAGDTRTLLDLPAGTAVLTVRPPGTRYQRRVEVEVEPDQDKRVELALEVGSVRVTNRTGEPVRVLVDGAVRRTVDPDVQTDIEDLVMGVHELAAVGVNTGREYRRTVQIDEGESIAWDLTAREGELEVLNRTTEPLTILIDGVERGPLAPGASEVYEQVPLGRRQVVARGAETGFERIADVPITAGHLARWVVSSGAGTAWIANRLAEPVEIRLEGEVIRTIEPGATAFIGDLPAGAPDLAAFATVSQRVLRPEVQVSPTRGLVWNVTEPEGRLQVRNQMPETAMIYADGRPLGQVPPGGDVVFTQVPPGDRLLEANLEGGAVIRGRASVETDTIVTWDVAAATGQLTVINEAGEPLVAPPSLAAQKPEVAPSARHVYEVPVGHRMFHFIGRESGLSYYERVTILRDDVTEWVARPQVGILHVFNRTPQSQRVTIDSENPVVLAPGDDVQLSVRAGAHVVLAIGEDDRTAVDATVVVRGGATYAWEILPRLGHVRIVNQTPETLDLRVDGGALGVVEPGAIRTYGPWPTGAYRLTAMGRWSKAVYEVELGLEPGRVEGWVVLPANGSIQVVNERTETVRVIVDKDWRADVPPGEERRVVVALGAHLVELIGEDTLAPFVYRPRVLPDRTYTVVAPKGPAQLRVVNQLEVPLQIEVDGLPAGQVGPGSDAHFDLPPEGAFTVLARDESTGRIHHRRVQVTGDRLVEWVIRP